MKNNSDRELTEELARRLRQKDEAYSALMALTKKLEVLNGRLAESEKVKSHFLSNIRNEINNPLTSVLTMCDFLISNPGLDQETLKSAVCTIHKEAFSLNFQLRNIFAAAELEAGESAVNISKTEIPSLVRGIADAFRHKALEKMVQVSIDIQERNGCFVFRADPEKLEWVVSNLLSNAIEYSPAGEVVEVKAWQDENVLYVSVADRGAGIDREDQEAIFERFRQLDTGLAKRHGGHGLGLSITKAALELLSGRITVSGKKGEGAVFTVSVPEANVQTDGGEVLSVDGNNFFFDENGAGERF